MKDPNLRQIADWAKNQYFPGLLVKVEHIRSLTNDVYLIKTPDNQFVLKIYGLGWREKSAIAWEVDLLEHLSNKGVKVAKAQVGVDGETVRTIAFGNQPRHAVLFEYANGHKPQVPFSFDLYEAEGRAVAKMHAADDDFSSSHLRHVLDEAYLIDDPISDALGVVSKDDGKFLIHFGDYLKMHIAAAQEQGLDWGPIHGDMTLDNLHVTESGEIYFYDFDSGGMGWRASDIQGWATSKQENPKQQSFLKGYREIRSLSDNDIKAAPYIWTAWEVWGLSSDFTNRIAKDGEQAVSKYLSGQIDRLRVHEERLKEWETR